jgi:hypothetical protein
MSGDVFEETEPWLNLPHNPVHIWPEVARIIFAFLFSCNGEWLAWISCSDAIHDATPRLAVKGSQIRPNRRFIHGFVFHARCQDFARKGFDLDKTDCSSIWLRHSDAEVESADTGAQGQNVKGTMIHKFKFLFCSQVRMSTRQGTHLEHVALTGFFDDWRWGRVPKKNLLALKNSCA